MVLARETPEFIDPRTGAMAETRTNAQGFLGISLPTVSVIIPALNEADNLRHVLPRIPAWTSEVVLVDGRSTDGTPDVARELWPNNHIVTQERRNRIVTSQRLTPERRSPGTVLRLVTQDGRGKGAALRSGIMQATGDIVVMLDADGSTDPAEIPAFVGALLAGADYAKGSRFIQGGGTADMPLFRRFGNQGLVTLTNLLFHTHFSDITYGYNAVWNQHKEVLALEIDGWAHEIVNNIRAARAGLRVSEVSSFEYPRIGGEAKLRTISAGWVILKAILRERLYGPMTRVARQPATEPLESPESAPWAAATHIDTQQSSVPNG